MLEGEKMRNNLYKGDEKVHRRRVRKEGGPAVETKVNNSIVGGYVQPPLKGWWTQTRT